MAAKRRTVVTFGLALGLRVSKVSTATGMGGVVVAKCRTVITFGLALRLRQQSQGSGGILVAKPRTGLNFGGERRERRAEERRGEERRRGRRLMQQRQRAHGGLGPWLTLLFHEISCSELLCRCIASLVVHTASCSA